MGRAKNSSFAAVSRRSIPTEKTADEAAFAGVNSPRIEQHGDLRLAIYGQHEQRTIDQLTRCAEAGDATSAVLCADGHVGYSQPIGGAIAYENYVSPSGVGYDIACGNRASRTDVKAADVDVSRVMDEIVSRISFGVGRVNNEPVDHPVLDSIRNASFGPQRQLLDLASKQLGTIGSGNHYVDLLEDGEGWLWVGVHFGSRGFGHKTATGFLSIAQGGSFEDKAPEGEMDSPPVLLDVNSDAGQSYIEAMNLAGEYAHAGRDLAVEKVLGILGAQATYTVHNHHNFSWKEEHDQRDLWVVRKGCTPAFPGQEGFVGGSMGDEAVILEGAEGAGGEALFSTVHGAGRVMSRTQAAGKKKKVWECGARDCDRVLNTPAKNSHPKKGACSAHPQTTPRKVWRVVRPGQVDFRAVQARLRAQGIELRGAGADEAPEVYKRLPEVLAAHGDQIRVNHRLRPVGVAMAGADVYDPFKD